MGGLAPEDDESLLDIINEAGLTEFVEPELEASHHIGFCPFHGEKLGKKTLRLGRELFICYDAGCLGKAGDRDRLRLLVQKTDVPRRVDPTPDFLQSEFALRCSERMELSYSMLVLFQQCPLRFHHRYVARKDDTSSAYYLLVGSAVHLALARFFSSSPRQRTAILLPSLVDEVWPWGMFASSQESDKWLARARDMLARFCNRFDCTLTPLGVELPFRAQSGNLLIKGKADRIDKLPDGTFEVIDYKLGDYGGRSEDGTEVDLQPAFYYYGLTRSTGLTISRFSYIFLQTSECRSVATDEERMAGDLRHIESIAEAIRATREYPPRRNAFCQDCILRASCQLGYQD